MATVDIFKVGIEQKKMELAKSKCLFDVEKRKHTIEERHRHSEPNSAVVEFVRLSVVPSLLTLCYCIVISLIFFPSYQVWIFPGCLYLREADCIIAEIRYVFNEAIADTLQFFNELKEFKRITSGNLSTVSAD